ncbi:hypothetical protein AVEN_210950-1 [Araneus ventricosus]|uniref:Histone-lysine N-methyltransferase SETMAR n=1 Tax=Araneus ventricosus TaxID=182803 RepID=A0A4Y2DEU8_ARAVE|nr:hypothetical protein AVEN_210950-1 [Araneus ventricosus]
MGSYRFSNPAEESPSNIVSEETNGDAQGILLIEFMTRGTTINSEVYCRMLKKLKRAIQNKRRGLLSSGVVLLHDNARPHTAVRK